MLSAEVVITMENYTSSSCELKTVFDIKTDVLIWKIQSKKTYRHKCIKFYIALYSIPYTYFPN